MKEHNKLGAFTFEEGLSSKIFELESIASPRSCVCFDAKDGKLTVSFYGKEIQSRGQFEIEDHSAFSFSAMGAEMVSLFKAFEHGRITVYDNHIRLNSDDSSLARQISEDIPPCEFPDFGDCEFQELPTDIFDMASFASFAAAKSTVGTAQEWLSILLRKGVVSICACDGYKGVRIDGITGYDGDEREYLLRSELTEGLAKLCKKDAELDILISSTHTKYLLKVGNMEITANILAAPSVRQTVDSAIDGLEKIPAMEVCMSAPDLTCFLQRTKLVEDNNILRRVEFDFDSANHTVRAEYRASAGELVEVFAAKYSGKVIKKLKIAFNPKLLLESCSRFVYAPFTAQLRGNAFPVLVQEQRGSYSISYLLLPVRPGTADSNVPDDCDADFSDSRQNKVVSTISENKTETGNAQFSEDDLF